MTTAYGTIKIPPEEYERHNKRRKELGVTWAEYIDKQAPAMFSDIQDQLNRIEDAVTQDESSGLMDAMNDSDAGCPECGGELVHEMGSEAKRCVACGWSENE